MRLVIALVFLVPLLVLDGPRAIAQPATPTPAETLRDDGVVIIDTPPAGPELAAPPTIQSDSVILDRPGQVLLKGTPVELEFRSPTNGVGFQLLAGGTYSSISGVAYGVGLGGYGAWGYGGYGFGVSPYYGEVVTKAYQPICETPCRATLLSGRHRMALSLKGGPPVNVRQSIDILEPSIIEGRYVDKSRLRKAGWAIFVSGAVAGLAMMFASVDYRNDPFNVGNQIRNPGVFYSGVGIFLSSIIAGSVLGLRSDEAHVNVYPLD